MTRPSRPAASNAAASPETSIDILEGAGSLGSTIVTVPPQRTSRKPAHGGSGVLEDEASTTASRSSAGPFVDEAWIDSEHHESLHSAQLEHPLRAPRDDLGTNTEERLQ